MISIFVLLPFLLLAVYPCGCFHKCLNCCGVRSPALHVFMDAFQGSYRTQPRDLRYFSALYLLLRMLLLAQPHILPSYLMFFTTGILSIIAAALVAAFQPYKVKAHNTIDSVLMMLMGIYFVCYYAQLCILTQHMQKYYTLVVFLQLSALTSEFLYFTSLVVWKLFWKKLKVFLQKIRQTSRTDVQNEEAAIQALDREIDVNRIAEYSSLLTKSSQRHGSY